MRRRGERGFALLIVLWTLPLLATISTGLLAASRQQTRIAINLRGAALAESAADGAVFEATWRLFTGQWHPDRSRHLVLFPPPERVLRARPEVTVSVEMEDESGKVNPNTASERMLTALMVAVGAEPAQASTLAAAVFDYRTPGEIKSDLGAKTAEYAAAGLRYGPTGTRFGSLDEMALVLGMPADLLARLRPHLSIYQEAGVDRAAADPVVKLVLDQLRLAGDTSSTDGGHTDNLVAQITASAQAVGGARFVRQAIVRLKADAGPDDPPPHEILTWARVEE